MDAADDEVRRLHVLRLLALIEHPDALPHDAVLRLSREMMVMLGPARAPFRCDSMPSDE
jgi:hypothetical protein